MFCFLGLCGPTSTFLSITKYRTILIKEEKEKGCVDRHFILLGFSKDSGRCCAFTRFHGDPFSSQLMIWNRKDKWVIMCIILKDMRECCTQKHTFTAGNAIPKCTNVASLRICFRFTRHPRQFHLRSSSSWCSQRREWRRWASSRCCSRGWRQSCTRCGQPTGRGQPTGCWLCSLKEFGKAHHPEGPTLLNTGNWFPPSSPHTAPLRQLRARSCTAST